MQSPLSRQRFLGPTSEQDLAALTVAVIGVGGGGSHIAQQLAYVGVGQMLLVDPDNVESTNLNRLVGATERDAVRGAYKVAVIAQRLRRLRPSLQVEALRHQWQSVAPQLRSCDIIFGCVDSFAARLDLERASRRYLIPYIDIGMDVHLAARGYAITGQVAVSLPGAACLRCMAVITDANLEREAAAYGAAGERPQVVWPNGVLASTAVGLMMQLVTPWSREDSLTVLVEYDGNTHTLSRASSHDHLRSLQCPHFSGSDDVGDPWFDRSSR